MKLNVREVHPESEYGKNNMQKDTVDVLTRSYILSPKKLAQSTKLFCV